jgi:hypothetical protein
MLMGRTAALQQDTGWKSFLRLIKRTDGSAELTLGLPFAFAIIAIASFCFGRGQIPQIRIVTDMLKGMLGSIHLLW